MLFLSIISIINFISMLVLFALYIGRNRNRKDAKRVLKEIRSQVNELVSEFDRVADRNISIIEDRVRQIESLIGDADKRIRLLGEKSNESESHKKVYSDLKKKMPLVPNSLDRRAKKSTVIDSQPELFVEDGKVDVEQSMKSKVVNLFNKGISSKEIASKLGITIGEVELVISLRKS